MSSQRKGSSPPLGAAMTPTNPVTNLPLHPINSRSSTPLPGLSTTASLIRNRRSSNVPTRSSLRKVHSSQLPEDEEDDEDQLKRNVDQNQLEELKKGVIMPGMGGNRANTESHSDPSTPSTESRPSTILSSATSALQQANQRSGLGRRSSVPLLSEASSAASSKSRLPATLKASILKSRHQTAASATSTTSSKNIKGAANAAKGTPAKATRYSLPVRGEKPVRTSKISGKHVMLPSESQLAPLPGEEEEEDDDDDDEEEEESSESSETEEGREEADDEEATKAEDLEEERLQDREAAKKRREEAQRSLEDRREEKAAQRLAKKPAGAPGYPSSTRFRGIPTTARLHPLPPLKGPAHARAPPIKPKASGPAYHTFERLAPSARVHTPLPRLTSYAVASSIHLPTLIGFLRREHSVRPRLYDECVYVVYFKPLLPGFGRAEVRSAPEPAGASPGGESRREREIVEREESGYVGSYFAATNKDDEGDHIDEQGYIMGGEGEGQSSENRNRDRQEDRGDMTETETEREGGNERNKDGQRLATEVSESETEAQLASETEYESSNRTIRMQDEELEGGLLTPKALEPTRREESSYFQEAQDELLTEEPIDDYSNKPLSTPADEQVLSNADVQGAMDLQHQQHLIESGKGNDGEVRFEDEEGRDGHRRSSVDNGRRQQQREDRRRRDKDSRKRRKPMGPNTASHNHDTTANMLTSRPIMEALQIAELIILPYGVLVMYNLSEEEERSIINDVISSGCVRGGLPYSPDDEETEAFHFCYDPTVPAPRIFNDFFTFRTSNHLLKLSLAHAIAQSTKLSVFEESMQRTLELTSHIPRELASSGELKLKRIEALKLTGRLFKLRVDVNLTSNVLDTPELFWSEASLKALYDAIREYLEIDQRVENLNERLAVGNDLLEVIHDHIGSQAMNQITWIIIILIVVACIVACGEISARLVVHARDKSRNSILNDPDFEMIRQLYYLTSSNANIVSKQANQLLLD